MLLPLTYWFGKIWVDYPSLFHPLEESSLRTIGGTARDYQKYMMPDTSKMKKRPFGGMVMTRSRDSREGTPCTTHWTSAFRF